MGHRDADTTCTCEHSPVVYGVCGSMVHGGAAIFSVHARRGTHSGPHLGRHTNHVGGHPGAIRPSAHLPLSYSSRWHVSVRSPAALTGHRVHGASHARAAGVVGIGHPCVAWLSWVTCSTDTMWTKVQMLDTLCCAYGFILRWKFQKFSSFLLDKMKSFRSPALNLPLCCLF